MELEKEWLEHLADLCKSLHSISVDMSLLYREARYRSDYLDKIEQHLKRIAIELEQEEN